MSDDEIESPRFAYEENLQPNTSLQQTNSRKGPRHLSFILVPGQRFQFDMEVSRRREQFDPQEMETFLDVSFEKDSEKLREKDSFQRWLEGEDCIPNRKSSKLSVNQQPTFSEANQKTSHPALHRSLRSEFFQIQELQIQYIDSQSISNSSKKTQQLSNGNYDFDIKRFERNQKQNDTPCFKQQKQQNKLNLDVNDGFDNKNDQMNIQQNKKFDKKVQEKKPAVNVRERFFGVKPQFKEKFQTQKLQIEKIQQTSNSFSSNPQLPRSKPICFNCGGSHYYNQCTLHVDIGRKQDMKCLNCKQVGHTARYCHEPRRCRNCQSTEHIARDCPSNQALNQKKLCGNCYKPGHFAKECPEPRKCYKCHQVGHDVKDCPQYLKKQIAAGSEEMMLTKYNTCFNCKKIGHYANQCPEPERCHNCNQEGHYSRDCPYMTRSMSISDHANKKVPEKKQKKQKKKQSRQKPQSQSALETGSKKLNLNNFHFKNHMKESSSVASRAKPFSINKSMSKRQKSIIMSQNNKKKRQKELREKEQQKNRLQLEQIEKDEEQKRMNLFWR